LCHAVILTSVPFCTHAVRQTNLYVFHLTKLVEKISPFLNLFFLYNARARIHVHTDTGIKRGRKRIDESGSARLDREKRGLAEAMLWDFIKAREGGQGLPRGK
jgi:hypothetical protein